MLRFRITAATGFTFALLSAASAHAQSARPAETMLTPVALQTTQDGPNLSQPFQIPAPVRSLQLDSNGRWGLRLDMTKPVDRPADWKDVEAGAYIKLTSRLKVGGSVGLGDKTADPQRLTPAETAAPRVHLETTFKF